MIRFELMKVATDLSWLTFTASLLLLPAVFLSIAVLHRKLMDGGDHLVHDTRIPPHLVASRDRDHASRHTDRRVDQVVPAVQVEDGS